MHTTADSTSRPLRVLWVTTKGPWPAHDGGRLLMDGTLRALDPDRVRVTLVHPAIDSAGEGPMEGERPACLDEVVSVPFTGTPGRAAWSALRHGLSPSVPITARRHRRPDVEAEVARRLRRESFDVVHVEQPHALANVPVSGPPVLLRTQNVEQDLWQQMARTGNPPRSWALGLEAGRVARWEMAALGRVRQIVAISSEDRDRLTALASSGAPITAPVDVIHPAMPATQAAGPALDGDPALALFASSSWGPNQDGARSFLAQSWPKIRAARPSCRLHVFGGDPAVAAQPATRHHPSPFPTESAFGAGALVVVPVRAASGVRMKILESWSRGLAVVTTHRGAVGLGPDGVQMLQSVPALGDLHRAVLRLADREAAEAQVRLGREWLRRHADPEMVGARFLAVYRRLAQQAVEDASAFSDVPARRISS